MDSMRSLNTSLPKSTSSGRRAQPREQLVQSFRVAALSVTNLYKTAANEQDHSRQSGYQDALDDLLAFLDKENLGLDDGEGWKVRQWATERLDGSGTGPLLSESDDDHVDNTKSSRRGSSSEIQRPMSEGHAHESSRSSSPVRTESLPPTAPPPNANDQGNQNPLVFTFAAGHTLPEPREVEMRSEGIVESGGNSQADSEVPPLPRIETLPRGHRTPHRHGNSPRHNTRQSARDLTSGAGSKRKFPFSDYFDISALGSGKDTFNGGGKRGRFV